MTELLTRPPAAAASSTTDVETSPSLWWRGTLAASWAVAVGVAVLMVCVLVVWATDSRSGAGAGQAIRVSLQLWLAAHKVPLHIGGGSLAVAPLGLTLGLAFVVARAAAVLARGHGVDRPAGVAAVSAAVGVPYAVLSAFVAAAANAAPVRPSPLAALSAGLVVGVLAAAWGAARGTGTLSDCLATLPEWCSTALSAAAVALSGLFVAGMLLTLASLAVHGRAAVDIADGLGGGLLAQFAMLLLDALLLPNAALAAVGYLAGPGFAVGAGSSVSLSGAHTGALPALPLLAALPHGAAPAVVRAAAVIVLLGAGLAMAWWVTRRADSGPWAAAGRAVLAGAIAGVLAAFFVGIAGGPAGSGRMAAVGASPWQVGLVLALELSFVAASAAFARTWFRR